MQEIGPQGRQKRLLGCSMTGTWQLDKRSEIKWRNRFQIADQVRLKDKHSRLSISSPHGRYATINFMDQRLPTTQGLLPRCGGRVLLTGGTAGRAVVVSFRRGRGQFQLRLHFMISTLLFPRLGRDKGSCFPQQASAETEIQPVTYSPPF